MVEAPERVVARKHEIPTLRAYQRTGAQFLAGRKRAAICDIMGLGKTCQAITAAIAIDARRVLVIGPLATALGWVRECQLWGGPALEVLRRKHETPDGDLWAFCAWTDLAWRLPSLLAADRWDLVIGDEIHRAKSGSRTQTGEAMWGSWKKVNGEWKRKPGLVDCTERLWALTGTPMPNRPIELYPLLNALGCSAARSREKFVERYCWRSNGFAPRGFDDQGALNLPELNEKMSEVMLRRTPATVPGELPELLRVNVPLEGEDVEHGNVQVNVDEHGRVSITRDGLPLFGEMSRYRAEMGRAKVPAVAEWVKDYVTDGNGASRPLVVFTHHKDVARGIADALPDGWAIVATGDDQPDIRQGKVDQFARADGPPVFIGTVAATGVGMNGLHRRTNACAFAEGEWSPADLDQAEGRIRRLGSVAGDAMAFYLLVVDSLESHIMETINEKRERIKVGVDGAATVRAAIVPAPAPPAPAPRVEVKPSPLPAADTLEWSYGRDRNDNWCARAPHSGLTDRYPHPWVGEGVTLRTKDGRETPVTLGERIATGPTWSLWTFTKVDMKRTAGWDRVRMKKFNERGHGRGIEGATDETPCSSHEQPAILACIEAARRLCQLDPDRALEQNGVGWRSGDHTCGEMMAAISPELWTRGTLTFARALLRTYKNTQIRDLWPAIEK